MQNWVVATPQSDFYHSLFEEEKLFPIDSKNDCLAILVREEMDAPLHQRKSVTIVRWFYLTELPSNFI